MLSSYAHEASDATSSKNQVTLFVMINDFKFELRPVQASKYWITIPPGHHN